MTKILRQLQTLVSEGRPFAAATLVATAGSSPQNTGARVLFLPDGRIIGTIGGGCMEAEARRIALDCLRKGAHRLFDLRRWGNAAPVINGYLTGTGLVFLTMTCLSI